MSTVNLSTAAALCPRCGPLYFADAEGNCPTCGALAVGEGATQVLNQLRTKPPDVLCDMCKARPATHLDRLARDTEGGSPCCGCGCAVDMAHPENWVTVDIKPADTLPSWCTLWELVPRLPQPLHSEPRALYVGRAWYQAAVDEPDVINRRVTAFLTPAQPGQGDELRFVAITECPDCHGARGFNAHGKPSGDIVRPCETCKGLGACYG